jgi:hypothetical protein
MLKEQLLNRVDLLLGRQSREINAVDLCAKRTCESDNTAIMDRMGNSVHATSVVKITNKHGKERLTCSQISHKAQHLSDKFLQHRVFCPPI